MGRFPHLVPYGDSELIAGEKKVSQKSVEFYSIIGSYAIKQIFCPKKYATKTICENLNLNKYFENIIRWVVLEGR